MGWGHIFWLSAFQHKLFSFGDVYRVYTHPMGSATVHVDLSSMKEKMRKNLAYLVMALVSSGVWLFVSSYLHKLYSMHVLTSGNVPIFVRFTNHWNVTRTIIHCAEGCLTSICTYGQASPVTFFGVEQKVVVVDFIIPWNSFLFQSDLHLKIYSRKLTWPWKNIGKTTIRRCISYWTWWFSSHPS